MTKKLSASFPLEIRVSLIGFAILLLPFLKTLITESDIERLPVEMHYGIPNGRMISSLTRKVMMRHLFSFRELCYVRYNVPEGDA